MDPAVAWFQEEQNGPAKRIWLAIWETMQELDQTQPAVTSLDNNNHKNAKDCNLIMDNNNGNGGSNGNNGGQIERTYYNPSRRKAGSTLDSNKASTFNMNRQMGKLIGKHGGCPWRPMFYKYGRGVLG